MGCLEHVSGPDGERWLREFVEGLQGGGRVGGTNLTLLRRSADMLARPAYRNATVRLGIAVREFPIEARGDYRDAAAALARSDADGIPVVEDADEIAGVYAFVRLAMATRRPAMFNADFFVEDENRGLMAYGVSLELQYRHAAEILARVLDGARPIDIPVEQPTRYELVVGLFAAQEYGHEVPAAFLVRADRVLR